MLQEATKLINSTIQNNFIKRLSLYLHDCVREEFKSSTFRNLKQDKDNKWVFVENEQSNDTSLLKRPSFSTDFDGTDSKITELMLQADAAQKDRYLIYGHYFLVGKNPRGRKEEYLTPILYTPCKLERNGISITCSLTDDKLSLNTGALASLIKYDDEDEVEHIFEGLIDVVPDLPLSEDNIQIFLTALKSIIPDIDIDGSDNSKVAAVNKTAIVLTKRPTVTAGLLHELTQISEKPVGIFRETSLSVIQEEALNTQSTKSPSPAAKPSKNKPQEFIPITTLNLSDTQLEVIKSAHENTLTTVYGPPGTGKSQTIVNLASHLIASGKTVLIASRMDKAVDVISERLNELGSPFLSLRAGRPNYQKELNIQLQDLLSNKIELDEGFESSILVSIDDMKTLLGRIKDKENNCNEILSLEHKWFTTLEEYNEQKQNLCNDIISERLSISEIETCRDLLEKINKSFEDKGFFAFINNISSNIAIDKVKNIIKNPALTINEDNLHLIFENLTLKEYEYNLKHIENQISKIGNIHQLLEDLKKLRAKKKDLAKKILQKQRRDSLKALTSDQYKRQRLMVHSKALIERKKNLQNRLLEGEDFQPLLEAFPCWATTTYAVSESLPLKPGLFDVVIIDEASQCDIASCFPVLFRAKKAVIVGDDKQLSHLSFLEKAKEQSFLSHYNISDKHQLMWRFRTNSVFDIANYYTLKPILLDEHFRSLPPIINFSNKEFYGNKIKIMNKETDLANCIELNIIDNAKVDLDNTRNMPEAEKIMEKLQEIVLKEKDKKKPSSIGVISPFRGQVELMKKAMYQVFTENVIQRHQIEIGTAHTFQGDEKDIIFLSFTLADNSHFQSLTFVQKPNLFNVAITRARKKLLCYISTPINEIQPGLLKNYLEFINETNEKIETNKNSVLNKIQNYNNECEQELAKLCENEELEVISQFDSAGYKVDLVVLKNKKQLAVEFCGHEENKNEVKKQAILERCGWHVLRITAREWHYSKNTCINRIKQYFNN